MQWRTCSPTAFERWPLPAVSSTRRTSPAPITRLSPSLAVIASFVSSYWVASRSWFAPASTEPIQTAYGLALGVYVQDMRGGKQVYDRFLTIHQSHEASPDSLVRQVGFTPLLPSALPEGFQLDKSYVLATTCCKGLNYDTSKALNC